MKAYNPEDYKYNNKGHCPRCNGLLLPAKYFFKELLFKDKAQCSSCARVWALDANKSVVLFQ